MPSRPKQRNLVRWNDDLDKSLLLFITHTCTELGIKIPYDEVARRMGSAFSEGAIQQHIAKLRNQMAELNVAPVPGPPRRGNVTKKPSSIYTQKARAGPAPPPPPPASKTRARTMTQADSDVQGGIGKARAKRRLNSRNIKRSASDIGDSEEEFDGASNDEFDPEQVAGSRKRKQSSASRGRANTSRRVSNSQIAAMSKTNDIMRTLSDADARFEAQYGGTRGHIFPGEENMFNVQNSIEENVGRAGNDLMPQPPFNGYAGYMASGGQGEEEEEEELPLIARNQLLARQAAPAAPLPFSQEEQISPTSTSHMMPLTYSSFPQFTAQGQGDFNFGGVSQQMPEEHNYASSIQENSDFGPGVGSFDGTAPSSTPMLMAPPSAFPSAVRSNMPETNISSPSTRNASFMSLSSSHDNMFPPAQTPAQGVYGFDGAYSSQPSPRDSCGSGGNASMDILSPTIQGMNDFDFLNMYNFNSDGVHAETFQGMTQALTG